MCKIRFTFYFMIFIAKPRITSPTDEVETTGVLADRQLVALKTAEMLSRACPETAKAR